MEFAEEESSSSPREGWEAWASAESIELVVRILGSGPGSATKCPS